MTWTVACFCGNVYTAPPDRCDACGSTLSYVAPGDTPTRGTATVGVPSVLAAGAIPRADPVGRWFAEFWGPDYNPAIIDELAAPEIRFEYSLHAPCRGRDEVRAFATKFRAAFPDLAFGGTSELIAEGDYVVGQWKGGGTHTGEAFDDMPIGSLPAGSGKTMRFTGTTVLKVENGLITEEVGLDDGVTALKMLGLIPQR